MTPKAIIYNGIKFTRDEKTGYYLSTKNVNGKRIRLHRYVWQENKGEIPKGFHIHHKNEDKSKNDISNLELMYSGHHSRLHFTELATEELKAKRKLNIARAGQKSKEWHRSKQGKEWHKEQYKVSLGAIEYIEFICDYCGEKFKTRPVGHNRFCSNKCKSAYRRKIGADNEERICATCSEPFMTNKFQNTVTCSRRCGLEYRKRNRVRKN